MAMPFTCLYLEEMGCWKLKRDERTSQGIHTLAIKPAGNRLGRAFHMDARSHCSKRGRIEARRLESQYAREAVHEILAS